MFEKKIKSLKTLPILLVLIYICGSNSAAYCQYISKSDSLLYANILKDCVNKIYYLKDSSVVIIAGEKNNKLIKIDNKGIFENVVEKYGLPSQTTFTDVLYLKKSHLMVGTKGQFIYFLRNKKTIWLNEKYGLTDAFVENFDYNKKQKLVVIKTANARFLLKNENKIHNIKFVEIKDTVSTFDDIIYYFRQNLQRPIQKKFLELVTGVDFSFRKEKYLNNQELLKVKKTLLPGDIILRRNELQLTNVGIPGFWTHSGIYVGSLRKLDSLFTGFEMLKGQNPSNYIEENYPEVYDKLNDKDFLVIEAIAEGVVIKPLEHIGNSDYLVALRTHLAPEDIFKSLLTAFEYFKTPYDYLFDFQNDNEVVCSELLYNSFIPGNDKKGVTFRMSEREGKPFLTPNDIARQYCKEKKEATSQFDMIYYFDGEYSLKKKTPPDADDFCHTLKKKNLK